MAGGFVEYVLRLKDEASGGLDDAAESAGAAEVSFAGLASGLAAVTAAVGAVGAAFVGLNQTVADQVNALNDMSTRVGVGAETLAGLKLAAEGSGIELGNLESSLRRFVQTMGDAHQGTGEAVDAFEALGISVADLTGADGGIIAADDGLRLVFDRLSAIPDATQRAAAAMDIFGRSAGAMLQTGALEDLDHFVAAAREFGVDVGPEASASAAEWQREMANLQTVLSSFPQDVTQAIGVDGAEALRVFSTAMSFTQSIVSQSIALMVRNFGALGDIVDGFFSFGVTGKIDAFHAALDAAGDNVDTLGGLFSIAADEAQRTADEVQRLARVSGGGEGGSGVGGAGPSTIGASGGAATVVTSPDLSAQLAGLGTVIETQVGSDLIGAITAQTAAFDLSIEEATREQIAAEEAALVGLAGQFQQVSGTALSGDLIGAVGMAGPQGAAIAGIASALEGIGQLGPEGVRAQAEGQVEAIKAGLEALPEILGDVLPDVITDAIPALTIALIEAFPQLIAAQAEMLLKLTVELPVIFTKAMINALFGWWDQIKDAILGGISKFRESSTGDKAKTIARVTGAVLTAGLSEAVIYGVNQFASGTKHVNRTQLAVVHKGEQISAPGQQGFGSGGGGITINITTSLLVQSVIPDLVREIKTSLGDLGLGVDLSPVTT